MTARDKKDYLRSFRKFQQSREAFYKPKVKVILMAQVKQGLAGEVVDFKPMFYFLIGLYQDVSRVWGHRVQLSIRRQAQKARQPIGFSQRIYDILKAQYAIDLMQDALDITEVTKKHIQEILTQAAEMGWGVDEVVNRLTDLSEVRARRIARTETVAASNIAGDIVAHDSGLQMNKEWLAILDHRTRHDHYNIHGTIVDIDSKFDVGGNPMRFPGDRGTNGVTTPAGETINCRCVCVYIPKVDSRGLAMAA